MACKPSRTKPTIAGKPGAQDAAHSEEGTTAQNLRLLRAILDEPTTLNASKVQSKRSRKPQSTIASKPVRAGTRKNADKIVDIHEDAPIVAPSSKAEQKRLATSCFNSSLKVLSTLVKQQQASRARREDTKANRLPLQARSPNKTKLPNDTELSSGKETDPTPHAECASAALDVLRQADEEGPVDDAVRRREQGAVLLLEKLISLDLKELCYVEASKIHDQYWKRRKGNKIGPTTAKRPECVGIATMLVQGEEKRAREDFNMICSFQGQILRLAILEGPSSITADFITAATLETSGSPADVIIHGHKDGFLEAEKAGEHLRTIAQALSKLANMVLRTRESAHNTNAFMLLIEAQTLKLTAWRMLGHKPDLQHELWPVVERGIRQLWEKRDDKDSAQYDVTIRCVKRVQARLQNSDYCSYMPVKLQNLLAQLAEANGDIENAMGFLQASSSDAADAVEKLFCQCKLAALQLDAAPADEAHASSTLTELLSSLTTSHPETLVLSIERLSILARLRKLCLSETTAAVSKSNKDTEDQSETILFEIVLAIFSLCSAQLTYVSKADDKLCHSLHLAVLKNIEAITDAEKYAFSVHGMLEGYMAASNQCLNVLTELEKDLAHDNHDQTSQSAIRALRLRLSNVYWRAHLHPKVEQAAQEQAIEFAQRSINALDGLPPEELSRAALGPRLEKLASMQGSAGRSLDARSSLGRAIRHYIAGHALSDAVEAALSKPSAEVWTDQASIAYQLGRVLRTYNTSIIGITPENSIPACMYDVENLPDFHRAVMLEYQALHTVTKMSGSSVVTELIECMKAVVKLASACQYRVWRLRFISSLTSRLVKAHTLDVPQRLSISQFIEGIISEELSENALFLKQYDISLRSLLCLQQLLLTGQASMRNTRDRLEALQRVVSSCSTVTDLAKVVDDAECLCNVLRACTAMALALEDYEVRSMCLTIRLHLLRCGIDHDSEGISSCHIQLAQCQVRLGDMSAAMKSLAAVDWTGASDELRFELSLTEAEFHLAASDLDQCGRHLDRARSNFSKLWPRESSLSSKKQIERDSVIARGVLLASILAFRRGNLQLAAQYARQAAKISVSIWAALAKRVSEASSTKHDLTISSLAEDLSQLNLDSKRVVNVTHSDGARYWPYLDIHARSLRHMAETMEHSGMYDDAVSFWEKLKNLASTIPQAESRRSPAGSLALLLVKSGKPDDAAELLSTGPDAASGSPVAEMLSHVEALAAIGHFEQAKRFLQRMPNRLITCTKDFDPVPQEEIKLSKPASKARRGLTRSKAIQGPAKRRENGKNMVAQKPAFKTVKVNVAAIQSVLSFEHLLAEDRRRALEVLLGSSDVDDDKADASERTPSDIYLGAPFLVHEQFSKAKTLLAKAWQDLCADSMASLLTESAVAFPSKVSTSKRKGRISFLQGSNNEIRTSPYKASAQSDVIEFVRQKLCSARQMVDMLQNQGQQYCPTDMLHAVVKMEARIDLLLTTMNYPFVTSSTSLVLKASQPKDVALQRERVVSRAETVTQDRSSLSDWPEISSTASIPTYMVDPKQIHDLPSSWSIVSLTLSEDGDELVLSKLVGRKSPFLVRIPLHRSNEGEGSEELVYEEAKKEVKDIIDKANSSSHDMRGTSDRATRAQWHADREALDKRLAKLLENIEDVWLGGFRGVMAPQSFDEKFVKQFGFALEQSLDSHLPSRQKNNNTAETKIQIHEHILETFLGLGSPDHQDLDDAIMDLLYFVVDILQFNGERNAYDEIDWDAMLVNIVDALRAFHEADSLLPRQARHTILILDKELELFPWEGLPCLIDHPVSRMPSLGTIFDRLALIRAQSPSAEAYTISRSANHNGGTYVLNPSLDLKSTQSLLQPILASCLPTYKAMINQAPSEAEFVDCLTNNDVLLYFGHGSGAQYIRGRTIRALDRCAVTWLMGCSSAKMNTCGKGESWGMPRWYMLGHSMAVVGCLWDVTDREIDRVSLKSMAEWGLVDGGDARVVEALKKKGKKGKEVKKQTTGGDVMEGRNKTLVEAVKAGRKASVLSYLCGAAVVVYGVPVILD